MISVRGNHYPTEKTADFLGSTYGGSAQSMCCSEIRRRNPSWTGDIFIAIIGNSNANVDVMLWSKRPNINFF